MTTDPEAVVVVPCYDEADRLDEQAFLKLAAPGGLRLLFVNDGSTDGTGQVLDRMAEASDTIAVLELSENQGKAEAVRLGLCRAVEEGASVVGYFDADLATPPDELLRLLAALHADPDLTGVFGSRVARLGSRIERSWLRHYGGRVYATVASAALGVTIYDTQCGAKVFRVNPALRTALGAPFPSAWSFDVILIQRLLAGGNGCPGVAERSLLEVPLRSWRDVSGSKLRLGSAAWALADVAGLGVVRRLRGSRR